MPAFRPDPSVPDELGRFLAAKWRKARGTDRQDVIDTLALLDDAPPLIIARAVTTLYDSLDDGHRADFHAALRATTVRP